MNDIENKFLHRLNQEAADWVEEELKKRMVLAKEAIEEQVRISMPEIGPTKAGNHLKKALAYAEEEIRMELEFEAQTWIDEELKKRKNSSGTETKREVPEH